MTREICIDYPVSRRMGETKFIADAMLGRLARWLRILGFDVLYDPDADDRQVVRTAREEGRTILTRDTALVRRKGLKAPLLITSNEVSAQLRELKDRLNFNDAEPLGRCAVCNGGLSHVARKAEVRDHVPEFVYLNFDAFLRCCCCGRIYWEGTHQSEFRKRLREILKDDIEN